MRKYYLDTSIWLDLIENRNEPRMPKGIWAYNLINKIVKNHEVIVYSNINLEELKGANYSKYEVSELLEPIKPFLIFVYATRKQVGKAKDLAKKRNVPQGDALHALIARDNKAIMITLDNHFKKLKDITDYQKPLDII